MADTQAITGQTHPLWAVEAKELWTGRIKADTAERAGIIRRKEPIGPPLGGDDYCSLAQIECLFHGLRQSPALSGLEVGGGLEPVDHRFDLMLDLAVERKFIGKADKLTINPGSHITGSRQVGEQVFILSLLTTNDRGQDQERCSVGQLLQDSRDNLLAGLRGHRPIAVGTVPLANTSIEHPQIVVDLSDRSDRRPRIAPPVFC